MRRALIEALFQAIGLGAVGYGIWLIYEPLAFIVGGAALVLLSLGLRNAHPPRS